MNKKPIVKVGVLGLILCLVLVTPGCGVCGFGPGQVLIRDPQLELAIRHALGVSFTCITRADMLSLTDLDAEGYGIRYLDGIEAATNLVNLNLGSNFIENLAPIRDLDKLVSLRLNYNQITDIEPVSGLDSLRFVDFTCNNDIENWDPLAAVVTTNNGFLEGGSVIFDQGAVTLICTVTDAEGNETEEECYTLSYISAANAIYAHALANNVDIDIILGFPVGDNSGQCLGSPVS